MWADNETDLDLLGFRVHAELVHSVVTDPKLLPVTIGIFADWGGGKTSLMKMLEKFLDPQSWPEDSDERKQCEKTACLYFNGWLFEGYDDAKSAILSSVLLALGEHKRLGPQVRAKCVSLLRSVNWMRVAHLGLKNAAVPAIAAFVSGGASTVPALVGSLFSMMPWNQSQHPSDPAANNITQHEHEDGNKIDWESLIRSDKSSAGPLDVRSFREQFGKMLSDCDIESLVILIDDLDRCSPERIIENLEAIKLFLNVEHTAFVIGADPRIIRHAIALKYHKHELLLEDTDTNSPSTVVTDYLEKLIQYPYPLPHLSPAEIETYMTLLFCQSHMNEELFTKIVDACNLQRTENRYGVFGYAAVHDTLKQNDHPNPSEDLVQALTFCAQASPLITEGLKGNPRQVKRFLNAFSLRKKLAKVAKLTNIKDDVLVKLMILEYSHEKRFRELYNWQATQKGAPKEIIEMEAAISELTKKLQDNWESSQLRSWMAMKPSLVNIDLRDYFWITRDRLQLSMSNLSMVPPLVRRLFESLIGNNPSQKTTAVRNTGELREDERGSLFDLLEQNIQQKPADKSGYDAFRALVEKDVSESAKRLASALINVPASKIPPAVGTDIHTICKSKKDLQPIFNSVLSEWEKTNTRVGAAVKEARKSK